MTPQIGIVMGSDSDLETMKQAAKVCEEFEVGYEIRVLSAHRTPHDATDYASQAHERGLKVIIAGAGGAAHLAGVVAGHTPLPVIGVPIKKRGPKRTGLTPVDCPDAGRRAGSDRRHRWRPQRRSAGRSNPGNQQHGSARTVSGLQSRTG